MIERDIEIKNKLERHARAAAKLVHTAARFKADIKVRKGDEEVDGKGRGQRAEGRSSAASRAFVVCALRPALCAPGGRSR